MKNAGSTRRFRTSSGRLIILFCSLALSGPSRADRLVVTSLKDLGPGTLRAKIQEANLNPGEDTITFDVTGEIELLQGHLPILDSVKILNADPDSLTVTIAAGAPDARIFDINTNGIEVAIHGLTLKGGRPGGDGSDGGAIRIDTDDTTELQLSQMVLTDNRGTGGGAISISGARVTISRSTIDSNSVNGAVGGGGILNLGTLFVLNSTICGNDGGESGGGIFNLEELTVRNTTITANRADSGGGIFNFDTVVELTSNLIANNEAGADEDGPDVRSGVIDNATRNVIKTAGGHTIDPATNRIGVDEVHLGPLVHDGFPTATKLPSLEPIASPAIDAGANPDAARSDQRGAPYGSIPDAGSVQSENRFFAVPGGGEGAWNDPANWDYLSVPVAATPALISGGGTADLNAGVPPASIEVFSLDVGSGIEVSGATGIMTGDAIDITVANAMSAGRSLARDSPYASGRGVFAFSDTRITTKQILVGTAFATRPDTVAEASGQWIMAGELGEVGITGFSASRLGLACASGRGSEAVCRDTTIDYKGASFGNGRSWSIAETLAERDATATLEDMAVDIDVLGVLSTGFLNVAEAKSFGGRSETAATISLQAGEAENDFVRIGRADASGILGTPSSTVGDVDFVMSAGAWRVGLDVEVGNIGINAAGTAQIDNLRFQLLAPVFDMRDFGFGEIFASQGGAGLGELSAILGGATTRIGGRANIGTLDLGDMATAEIDRLRLVVDGGCFIMPDPLRELRICTLESDSSIGTAKANVAAEFISVVIDIEGSVRLAYSAGVSDSVGAGSSLDCELLFRECDVNIGGDLLVAQGSAANVVHTALVAMNPSYVKLGGTLDLGAGSTLRLTIAGGERAAPGLPGDPGLYSAIDAENASLDGALQVLVDPAFAPVGGESFTIIETATAVTGSFGNASEGTMIGAAGNGLGLFISYGAAAVTLTAAPANGTPYEFWALRSGLIRGVNDDPGVDANDDGTINLAHFASATDPLGLRGGPRNLRVELAEFAGDDHLTLTTPVRAGAVFDAAPNPSALRDGVSYTVLGDSALRLPGNLTVLQVSPAMSLGLPPLPDLDGDGNSDWVYASFRLEESTATLPEGFLRVRTGS